MQEHKEDLIEELATTIVQKVRVRFSPGRSVVRTPPFSLVSFNAASSKKDYSNVESE